MADLVVLVPSRERPEAVGELAAAFDETCTADTSLMFVVDDDDPTIDAYRAAVKQTGYGLHATASSTMVEALNLAAPWVLSMHRSTWQMPFAVGFMGDDHRPRTQGWDAEYLDALKELGTGIVYGNDGYQGEKLPTQCAMTADIIRALGFMAPPTLRHMYVDNFWYDLGSHADRLTYLPDVLVEHMHPVAGKAEWSEGHRRVNAPEVVDRDAEAYGRYVLERFEADLAKVQALNA